MTTSEISQSKFNYIPDMKLLEKSFNWIINCLPFKQNSYLFESMQKFILEYSQHGHMAYSEHSESRMSNSMSPSYETEEHYNPRVLTMTMLSAGFKIWLSCVVVCVAVFFIEIIIGLITSYFLFY